MNTAGRAAASLNLGLIGNCQVASLIDADGTHVWTCLPRLDGDPAFCELLAGSNAAVREGRWAIELIDQVSSAQIYERNTAILETTLTDSAGATVSITDFCPRFRQYGRNYRPAMLVRSVRPLAGRPRLRMTLSPMENYGERERHAIAGSHHIRYPGRDLDLRLTTDASIASITEQRVFVLDRAQAFILGPDENVHESVPMLVQRLLDSTREYWNDWVRSLAVPFEWQEAVIRAAITLKLCSFEDTGAIIAAITTSIPESSRQRPQLGLSLLLDPRFLFLVQALNRLGATRTMEGYLRFVQNLTATPPLRLQPCYAIDGDIRLDEIIVRHLPGYRGMGPVRIGNAAYQQVQDDVYGARDSSPPPRFLRRAPDAARNRGAVQRARTAAVSRRWRCSARGCGHLGISWSHRPCIPTRPRCAGRRPTDWRKHRRPSRLERARGRLARHARRYVAEDPRGSMVRVIDSFTTTFRGDSVDASLLLLAEVGLVDWRDPKISSPPSSASVTTLRRGTFLARYVGRTISAIRGRLQRLHLLVYQCALGHGQRQEARDLFEEMLRAAMRSG